MAMRHVKHVLKKRCMKIRSTFFAIIFLRAIFLSFNTHTISMLPDIALLALDHKAHVFGFSLCAIVR